MLMWVNSTLVNESGGDLESMQFLERNSKKPDLASDVFESLGGGNRLELAAIVQDTRPANTETSLSGVSSNLVSIPLLEIQDHSSAPLPLDPGSTRSFENPFTEFYGAMCGRGAWATKPVRVYFPHATHPCGAPMDLVVRTDAIMEEVLGFALWSYWKEGWLPLLDDSKSPSGHDPLLTTAGWILWIAEDGEVDKDFPRESFTILDTVDVVIN
jgi:hypothetical protein